MRDLTIAKFPIPISELEKEITSYAQKNVKIPIMQFIGMLNSRFVGNMASHAYGMNFLFEYDEETGSYKRIEAPKKAAKKTTTATTGSAGGTTTSTTGSAGSSRSEASKEEKEEFQRKQYVRQDRVLDLSGISDGVFKLPKLSIYPECVPDKDEKGKSILRMHVVDETCSSFSTLSDMLRSSNSVDINMFGFTNDPNHPTLKKAPELNSSKITERREKALDELKSAGVIKRAVETIDVRGKNPEIVSELEIDPGKLLEGRSLSMTKRFISRGMPTIQYGREGGTIKSIGLQSLSDPGLANVNILRMAKTDHLTPDLSMQRGLPVQVAPTECSIEMMGCPLISFGQQFFVDFGTGTTADNTYNVTGIDHRIDPGSFTTSVKLTFTDSYGRYTSQSKKIKTASALIKAKNEIVEPIEKPDPEHPSNSNLSQNEGKLFFYSVGLDGQVSALARKIHGTNEKSVEFAIIVSRDKKRSNLGYYSGKDAKANAIKESSKHQNACVLFTMLDPSMYGNRDVAVYIAGTGKPAPEDVCNELIHIGPSNGAGKITTNFDELRYEYSLILKKDSV